MTIVPNYVRSAPIAESSVAGLPVELQRLLVTNGTGRTEDGYLRLLDPAEMRPHMARWFADPSVTAFGSTAFGDLLVWADGSAWFASPRAEIIRRIHATPAQLVEVLHTSPFMRYVLNSEGFAGRDVPAPHLAYMPMPWRSIGGAASFDSSVVVGLVDLWDFHELFSSVAELPSNGARNDEVASWGAVRERAEPFGLTPQTLKLPGDADVILWEGGLEAARAGDGSWQLVSTDYGTRRVLRTAGTEHELMQATAQNVGRPIPEPSTVDAEARERLLARMRGYWAGLEQHLGQGPAVVELPHGAVVNRLGSIDGFLLYPAETSIEQRSLPPTVLVQRLEEVVVTGPLRVRAELTPAWFGHPGGGTRLTIAEPTMTVRDLVAAGALTRIRRQ